MEHIVDLLQAARLRRDRGHGGLPGQPHPHLLRRRLRVRRADGLRHRGDAARHRRLGPQRHGRARRALPRDLRRRPHRHRPRRDRRRSTRSKGALATIGLVAVENPLEFGIVITQRGRLDRALPREADVGPGVQRHHQHRHLRARAGDLRLHRRRTGRSTSPARCSRRCSSDGKPLYGAVAEGYWEDVGTLEAYVRAHKDVLDGKVAGRRPRLRARRRRAGSARAPRSTPTPRSRAPPSSATNCRVEAGARLGDVHRARHQRPGPGRRRPRARSWSTTTPTSARACRLRGAVDRPGLRPARAASAATRASVLGDECFVGERRRSSAPA